MKTLLWLCALFMLGNSGSSFMTQPRLFVRTFDSSTSKLLFLSPEIMHSVDQGYFELPHTATAWLNAASSAMLAVTDAPPTVETDFAVEPFALSPTQTILVFAIGLVPFTVATIEFWRRIAFGESFGTGSDSVVIIGENDAPESSRGQRVLGQGALVVAYVLFAVAAGVLGLVIYAVTTSDSTL